ncbi:MAG: ABC transporter permease [Ruminococcus sp.]|nr:ABC transporter permease [Ruminococcus sp.]MCM1382220.1 ABC transporter permease [Muribaculaceae bacterium]MCM1478778.1 ABC transporter permease [Muribaculaceae bacterium]
MRKNLLYPKLAASGIKNNSRTYIPYILTCAGMIMMFYIVTFLRGNSFVAKMRGGDSMQLMLSFGVVVMVIFSAIFMFYTNSFLIRGRKKEFGLYNILGMGKRNIARIMVWETVIVYLSSLIVGNGCGILFSKLSELFLIHIMKADVDYEFQVDLFAIGLAAFWYAAIFFLIMLNSLRQISLTNPIELMKSESVGEKPPKSNFLLTIPAVLLLGTAYYMAVTIENPIKAIFAFFLAVVMVIIATYLLFIAGSVTVCRGLQKNKKYYYKTNHFVSISSMAYRMKRNGAGLASICILSTMVLVTLSSTICLYVGEEKMLEERYPRDILINAYSIEDEDVSVIRGIVNGALEKYGESPQNEFEYRYISISGVLSENSVVLDPTNTDVNAEDAVTFTLVPAEDYNKITGKNISLARDEIMISSAKSEYAFDELGIQALGSFKVKGTADGFVFKGETAAFMIPEIYLFVSDIDVLRYVYEKQFEVYEDWYASYLHNYYGFDLNCDEETKIKIYEEIYFNIAQYQKDLADEGKEDEWCGCRVESKENDKAEFFGLYGGLFFLGIIFGTVFIVAAALIMYYKQISEGFEDKARFGILQKVGMTKREIKRSINSQVLTVFFLPLISAGVHMAFAFPMISRLLMLFGLTDTALFTVVTLLCFGAFSAVYVLVYLITSKVYYNIVQKN